MISSPLQSTLKVASGAVLVASEILEHCTKSVLQRAATSVPQGPTPNPVPETDKQPQPLTRPQFPDVFGENDLQKLRGSSSSDPLIEHRVPASPVERILQFGGLSMSLAMGAVSEAARRIVSPLSPETKPAQGSPFLTTANAERLTAGLCRMRGAALKLGQMLSIQDESLVPPDFQKILDRVRSSANMMPRNQLLSVLREDLGEDWESKLGSFDFSPIAAASIGQVHRATLKTGEQVVMKVQYPGVATSIKSDLLNVKRILQYTNVFPKGLYMDQLLKVAHDELSRECDYTIEAANQKRFKELLIQDHDFHVPKVYDELSSKRILTSEFVNGVELDHVKTMSLERRNAVAERLLRLCLHELFKFHFMQTDPNWANFLYNPHLDVVYLLDFGSCSQYDEDFIRHYLSMVWACANMDREAIINHSIALGFLTGQESKVMLDAHVESAFVVGEPFRTATYNFAMSSVPARLSSLAAVMVEHRLTPPPIEAYALHRKLSGFYLACIKLGAQIACRNSLETIVQEYGIDDVKSTAF